MGLVTSVTYLTVAYTLPSAFCLKLLRRKQPRWENVLQVVAAFLGVYISLFSMNVVWYIAAAVKLWSLADG